MPRTVKLPDERRQELLDIGIDLFLTKGSAGVSIQNVISRANVATGLFYYYFQSKEAFVEEAVTRYISNLSAHFAELLSRSDETALVNIKNIIEVFFAHVEEAFPLVHDEVVNTPQFHMVMHGILKRLCPAVERLIEKGVADGDFHVASPKITAGFLLNGLVYMFHAGENALPERDAKAEVERIILAALGADTE